MSYSENTENYLDNATATNKIPKLSTTNKTTSTSSFSCSPSINTQPLYEEISVIGNGAYGTVYKGIDLKTNKIVAMKRIRIKITEEGLPISTVREIAYLRHLEKYEHENIVKLLDVCHGPRLHSEQNIILIFEYVDFDLDTYLRRFKVNLTLDKIMDLMKQILVGIDFLHTNRIIHRDLKPQNILITKDGQAKIADFGLARVYGFTMALTSVVVTLWYRAPEVLLQSTYSTSVDIWSVGCIFAELYLRRPFFCGSSDIDQLYKIFEIMGLPTDQEWPSQSAIPRSSFNKEFKLSNGGGGGDFDPKSNNYANIDLIIPNLDSLGKSLLLSLLDYNLFTRITARDALLHDYFKQSNLNESTSTSDSNSTLNASSEQNSSSTTINLQTLPDITNFIQPNILKRKRTVAQTISSNALNNDNQQTTQTDQTISKKQVHEGEEEKEKEEEEEESNS